METMAEESNYLMGSSFFSALAIKIFCSLLRNGVSAMSPSKLIKA